jgi:hypothetical protein
MDRITISGASDACCADLNGNYTNANLTNIPCTFFYTGGDAGTGITSSVQIEINCVSSDVGVAPYWSYFVSMTGGGTDCGNSWLGTSPVTCGGCPPSLLLTKQSSVAGTCGQNITITFTGVMMHRPTVANEVVSKTTDTKTVARPQSKGCASCSRAKKP